MTLRRLIQSINIGGSNRMEVVRTGDFQAADRASSAVRACIFIQRCLPLQAIQSNYYISYDWYVDTSLSPGNYGIVSATRDLSQHGQRILCAGFPCRQGCRTERHPARQWQTCSQARSRRSLTQKYGAHATGFLGQTFLRVGSHHQWQWHCGDSVLRQCQGWTTGPRAGVAGLVRLGGTGTARAASPFDAGLARSKLAELRRWVNSAHQRESTGADLIISETPWGISPRGFCLRSASVLQHTDCRFPAIIARKRASAR